MTASAISLRPLTRHNLGAVCRLDAGDGGRQVASNQRSMAQAAVHAEAWPRAIYEGELPVGFLMLNDPTLCPDPETPEFFLWRLMVDRGHQGRGIGRAALRLLVEHVRGRPGATRLMVSHVDGADATQRFYESLGFVPTGELDEDEHVMALRL